MNFALAWFKSLEDWQVFCLWAGIFGTCLFVFIVAVWEWSMRAARKDQEAIAREQRVAARRLAEQDKLVARLNKVLKKYDND